MEPFDSYPKWLRENPRCLSGASCRTGYGLMLQRIIKSRPCKKDLDPNTLPRRP